MTSTAPGTWPGRRRSREVRRQDRHQADHIGRQHAELRGPHHHRQGAVVEAAAQGETVSALEEYQLAKEMFNECVLSETADAAIAELEAALAERERQLNEAMSRLFRIDGHFASNLMGIWKNRARAEEGSE